MSLFDLERKIIAFFPINKRILLICLIFVSFSTFFATAQTKHQRYLDYIERYKMVALEHERDYGVPASITLAQGILESSVGQSKMALEANNHFGIKAYHWKGEVYGGDSLGTVGYRKYGAPEDSFLDHVKFLKGPRYSVLYQLDVTDYRSWAQGLRDCGYAEDEAYPTKLISIIEQYELYALDGGKRMGVPVATATAEVEEAEETTDNGRWHHRKRRNRTQQTTVQEPSQEQQQPYTPLVQGGVASSADND
jgi:hypothetical protein